MSWLSLWLFRRAFRVAIDCGYYSLPMRAVFIVMHEEMQRRYQEDNRSDTRIAMQEQFDVALTGAGV